MSLPPILELQADDLKLMLAANCHLGSKNESAKMKRYVFSRREDGIHIIHLGLLWEKLVLAARIIVAIENPRDVCIVSSGLNGRRSALKFAEYVGTTCFIDRYIPGTLTNTTVQGYTEPLLLISTDPYADAQVINESQYCNMPVIALANSHTSLKNVDVAIPCNNVNRYSIGVITWLLARTVLRLKGWLSYNSPWSIKADMFFYLEEKEDEFEQQDTQPDTQWRNQLSRSQGDWKGKSSMFEPQSSSDDKVLWSKGLDDDNNSNWMKNPHGPILSFNEVFGQTADEPTNWADDVDTLRDPIFAKNTGGWGPPTFEQHTPKKTSPDPKKESTTEAKGWGASNYEETDGWGPSSPTKQRQWGQ